MEQTGIVENNKTQRISDEEARIIDRIRVRLNDSVTSFRILNWLNNFPRNEWDKAMEVLENLKHFTINQIVFEYNKGIEKLLQLAGTEQPIYVHGYGKLGKSGSTMLYFFKQAPLYKANEQRFIILNHVVKLTRQGLKNESILVLLDDIIGSGRSLLTYYQANIDFQLKREQYRLNLFALCIAYMNAAETLFKTEIPGIWLIGTPYKKAFTYRGSVFGYPPRMKPMREWCYRWGEPLFKFHDRFRHIQVAHPLGYENSQTLIVFAHSVPNNTLPIIWSVKNGWYPLFPRSGQGKLSEVKDFRQDNYYWLNMAYRLKLLDRSPSSAWTHKLDFGLIAVMRLKNRLADPQHIFQFLGISVHDYEDIMEKGVAKGIFDNRDRLTQQGQEKYNEITKQITIENTRMQRKNYTFKPTLLYIPKQFGRMT